MKLGDMSKLLNDFEGLSQTLLNSTTKDMSNSSNPVDIDKTGNTTTPAPADEIGEDVPVPNLFGPLNILSDVIGNAASATTDEVDQDTIKKPADDENEAVPVPNLFGPLNILSDVIGNAASDTNDEEDKDSILMPDHATKEIPTNKSGIILLCNI